MVKSGKKRNILPIVFLCLFFSIYGIYLFFAFAQVPMDSDFASLVLEANDILNGNILLKGWHLTNAPFTFTEIPFYVLGSAFFGINVWSYIFANMAMVLSLFFFGFLLIFDRTDHPFNLFHLIFIAIAGFPNPYLMQTLRGHVGLFVIIFAALYCLKLINNLPEYSQQGKRLTIIFLILVVLGTASDIFIFPILIAPILFISVFKFINFIEITEKEKRIFWLTILGVIFGKVCEKALVWAGGAPTSKRPSTFTYNNLYEIPQTILKYIDYIFNTFGCNLNQVSVFSLESIIKIIHLGILIWGTIIVFQTIKDFLRKEKADSLSLIISLGIVFLTILIIILPFLQDPLTGRYFSYFPTAYAILIIRSIQINKIFVRFIPHTKISIKIPLEILSLFVILFSIQPISISRIVTPQDRLATFLRDNGLIEGYSDFWNSNHVIVSSKDRVRVRPIVFSANKKTGERFAQPLYWFSKSEWYKNPNANFVVIKTQGDYAGYHNVKTENVLQYFGEPLQKLEFEDYMIFVYPKGISEKIVP